MRKEDLRLAIICAISFLISILIFAWHQGYIVFNFRSVSHKSVEFAHKKKSANLFYWAHSRWNKEETDLIWADNTAEDVTSIVKNWLVLIEEENLVDKKITLLSCIVGPNGSEIYLSFDRNLIDDEQSTINKLMLIESLLKTIRENTDKVKKVRFLKHHQTIWDNHLDLYHSWPIEGFLN